MIVLWNTIYMEAVLNQLRLEGHQVFEADVTRLSRLIHDHINMLGRYSFAMPETVARGELRPLRIRLLTKNSSYNAAIVADDGLTGLSVPMFPKPRLSRLCSQFATTTVRISRRFGCL